MNAVMGQGEFTYQPAVDWAKLPEGFEFGDVAAIATDRWDRVYAFNRGKHPMIVLDRDGKFLMYERGEGVKQDLAQALKWYGIAAREGDAPSRARVEFLRGQLKATDVQMAVNATQAFAPLAAPASANVLPVF